MTWLETEDIAIELKREARRGWPDKAVLLDKAAEAIEFLRNELTDAEGAVEYLEQFEP